MNAVLSHRSFFFLPRLRTISPQTRGGADMTLPALPVQTPRALTVQDGTCLVAGLTWAVATGPEVPVIKARPPLVLRLPGLRAEIDREVDRDINRDIHRSGANTPPASLLLAMGAGLLQDKPDASGTWAFVAKRAGADGAARFLLTLADLSAPDADLKEIDVAERVTPRAGPEALFDDPGDVLAALQTHLGTTEIAGIATWWHGGPDDDCAQIEQGLIQLASGLPVETVTPRPDISPAFADPPRIPPKTLALAGCGLVSLCALVFVVLPFVQSLFASPPPPPIATVDVQVEQGAFAETCGAAMDAWWPRSIGWEISGRGCALSTHLPASLTLPEMGGSDRLFEPLVIWAQFAPAQDRNPVLARSAAERMIKSWPYDARLDAESLTLWHVEALPMVEAITAAQTIPTLDEAAKQLSEAWAEVPSAIAAGESSITVAPPQGTTLADLFDRSAHVSGFGPVRFIEKATGQGALDIEPIRARQVPAALFDSKPAENTQ